MRDYLFRYVRPTQSTHGHTNVFRDGKYIGYMMPCRSRYERVGENWHFHNHVGASFYASNRKALVQKITAK